MISIGERQRRWESLTKEMERNGCEIFVAVGREGAIGRGFLRYLTDWHLWGGVGFFLYPKHGEPSLYLGSESQVHWAEEIHWVKHVSYHAPAVDGLITELKRLGSPEKVHVAGLGSYLLYEDGCKLKEAFPHTEFVDATPMLQKIIMVKSQEELDLLQDSVDAVTAAMIRFKEVLQPGKTECEVVSQAWQVARERGIVDGIAHISHDLPPFIHPPLNRIIRKEDTIKFSMEMAGASGYWIELSAIFSFGQPDPVQLRQFNTTYRAVQKAMSLLCPGTVGSTLVEEVEKVFREDDWADIGRIIWDTHGIGVDVIEYPIVRNLNPDILQENMVMSLHPGLTCGKQRMGVYIQDNYVVKPGGAVPQSSWEHKWHIIG